MKSLHNEFLGALFGAWLGFVTKLWEKELLAVFLFIFGIGLVAVMISVASSSYKWYWRVVAGVVAALVVWITGTAFSRVEDWTIFVSGQENFYYTIIFVWFVVSLFSEKIHQVVKQLIITRTQSRGG